MLLVYFMFNLKKLKCCVMRTPVFTKFMLPLLLTAFSLLLFSCNHSSSQNGSDENSAAANYQNYCAGCHGVQLEKFEKKEWMYGNSNEAIVSSIIDGRPEMGMPAFKKTFSEAEIEALAEYVKKGIPENQTEDLIANAPQIHESDDLKYVVDTVVSGLNIPWGLEFLPNGDLLISERSGILYRFTNDELIEIAGLPPIFARGQGGLLDLQLHPDYRENGWLYIAFSDVADEAGEEGGNTSIIRARLDGNRLVDVEKIFNGEPDTNKAHHFGCKLVFDREGYLYFGIGDRGYREFNPQSLSNHNGKIHRIHDDGSVPADNPFVNEPGAMPSIYSYGHRNPQGTVMHPETGEIWESEHGPRGGDELNLIKPGLNYGWPVISYGINYDGTTFTELTEKEGMEQPVTYWDPSIAPCGMTFVTGDRYPAWKHNILIGSLRFKNVERVVLDGYKVLKKEQLVEDIGRVRNVKMSPDGYIYVAIETPGKIVRLIPVNE